MRNIVALLLSWLSLASPAFAIQTWESLPGPSGTVAAGFVHDDGGTLILMCDPQRKYLMMGLIEPRAKWQKGQQLKFMTHSDAGGNLDDTLGIVMSPTFLVIGDDTTWHLHAMGKATTFFGVGTGEYARVFPAAGFRKAMEPVLQACGDHW
jgi:hypothetical protein